MVGAVAKWLMPTVGGSPNVIERIALDVKSQCAANPTAEGLWGMLKLGRIEVFNLSARAETGLYRVFYHSGVADPDVRYRHTRRSKPRTSAATAVWARPIPQSKHRTLSGSRRSLDATYAMWTERCILLAEAGYERFAKL
jgi:hypothetical protein